jgi:hypothetical protein
VTPQPLFQRPAQRVKPLRASAPADIQRVAFPVPLDGPSPSETSAPPCSDEREDVNAAYHALGFISDFGSLPVELESGEVAAVELATSASVSSFDFPIICSTHLIQRAYALTPDGNRLDVNITQEDGLEQVRLPLLAYTVPGLWHLIVIAGDPSFDTVDYFSLGISIPAPQLPFYLEDEQYYLLGGFAPSEAVVGVVFADESADWFLDCCNYTGEFRFEVDSDGYALVSREELPAGYVAFIGEQNHIAGLAAIGQTNRGELVVDMGDDPAAQVPPEEIDELLYEAYWGEKQ